MTSTSWMIVELSNIVSAREESIEGIAHQRTLLPAPATKKRNYQPHQKGKRRATTYVSHGSKVVNSVQMISTLRVCPLERTMSQSHRAAIHSQCYNFSMDRGERANVGCLSVTRHLPDNVNASCL